MSLSKGGGVGQGFQEFIQSDNVKGVYADAAARDVYFGANQSEVNRVASNVFLIIQLLDDGFGEIAFQQYLGAVDVPNVPGDWNDTTSLIKGNTGPPGATGNSYFFAAINSRDNFFFIPGNEALLEEGLPNITNVGDKTASVFVWDGVTSPVSYDPVNWRTGNLQARFLFLGESGTRLSNGNDVLGFISAEGDKHYLHGVPYGDTGSEDPSFFDLSAKADIVLADVFDTQLATPNELSIVGTGSGMNIAFKLRAATTGKMRVQAWDGVNDTGPNIVDTDFNVIVADIGNEVEFKLENDFLTEVSDNVFVRVTGVDLFGGFQTSGPFTGQTVAFSKIVQQASLQTDLAFQNGPGIIQKPTAAAGGSSYILNDFTDVNAWDITVIDFPAGDPQLQEHMPFGKLLFINNSPAITLTNFSSHYNHAFSDFGTNAHSLSNNGPAEDLFYEVFGFGDDAQANNESVRLGWDNTEGVYKLDTIAAGTGVKRNLKVETGLMTFSDTALRSTFVLPELLATNGTGWDNPNKFIVKDTTIWSFGTGNIVTAHDITDLNNVKLSGSQTNVSLFPITSYTVSPADATQTRVFAAAVTIAGGTINIAVGTYQGNHIVVRSDQVHGNFFDIDVVFVDNPASTTLATFDLFGNYSAVRLEGNHIHAVDNDNTYWIYHINGSTLIPEGRILNAPEISSSRDIVINGDFAYWITAEAASTIGFAVVDISNLSNPIIVNTVDNSERFFKAAIKDDHLYVTSANAFFGVKAYTIEDPANPVLLSTSPAHGLNITAIEIKGNVAYILAFTNSFLISVDISNPSSITDLDIIAVASQPVNMTQFGNFIAVVDAVSPTIGFVDISDPDQMVLGTALVTDPATTTGKPTIVGDRMYIPSTNTPELQIYSLKGINVGTARIEDIESEKITVNRELIANKLNVHGSGTFGGPVNFLSGASIEGRKVFGTPNNVVYFTKESDLPAPVAGVIALQANTTYVMYNDDPTASQKAVILVNRLAIPDAGGLRITSIGLATALLIYTGTGNLFTTTDTFTGFFHIDEIFISAPTGTIFDIDGVLPIGAEYFPRIFLSNMGFFNTAVIGTIKTISVNMDVGAFFDCGQGLLLDTIEEALIDNWRFTNWKNEVGAVMLTATGSLRFPKINGCTFETAANETAFDIRPNIGQETFIITGNSYRGDGTLYASGPAGDLSLTVTGNTPTGTITSVSTNIAGESIFTAAAGTGFVRGQFVILSGFTETQYNGAFEVLEVISSLDFRIHVAFSVNDTGSWLFNQINFTTLFANTLISGDGVVISGTGNSAYDGRHTLLGVSSTTFSVIGNVVGNITQGGYESASLTETDPIMRVVANAGIPDSRAVCAITAQNIAMDNTTITTQNSFVLLNLQASGVPQVNPVLGIERFEVQSIASGSARYIGLEEFRGTMTVTMSVQAASGSPGYTFRVLQNGVHVGAIEIETEAQSSAVSTVTIVTPVTATNGDVFQAQVANISGTQDIQIRRYTMVAS